ncbi:MAG: hypothetical protein FWH29_09470 [Methanobrevibacter sp.]|nr:hypothetical protein [Methanobrevibacter sp.]
MDKKINTLRNNNRIARKKSIIAYFKENSYKNSTIINRLGKTLVNISRISIVANAISDTIAMGLSKFKNNIYIHNPSFFNTLDLDISYLNFNIFYNLATNFFTINLTYFNSHKFSFLNKINNFYYSTFHINEFYKNNFYKNIFFEKDCCYSLNFKSYNIKYTSFFNENSCNNSYNKYITHFNRPLANASIKKFFKAISYTLFHRNKLVIMMNSYFLIIVAILKLIFTVIFSFIINVYNRGNFFYS